MGGPFYLKMGSMVDFSLGNGLIVDDYSNICFLPVRRVCGMQIGLDGRLLGIPFIGIEALTNNIARFDVFGGRLYARPFAFLDKGLLSSLQFGITGMYDKNPLLYTGLALYKGAKSAPIYEVGADITLPLLNGSAFHLLHLPKARMR